MRVSAIPQIKKQRNSELFQNFVTHIMFQTVKFFLNNFRALNFFSGCVRMPIRHNCGVAAWAVIFRVLRDTTNALLPNCQFTGQSKKLFSTTQVMPFRVYKPTNIQIAPRVVSSSVRRFTT